MAKKQETPAKGGEGTETQNPETPTDVATETKTEEKSGTAVATEKIIEDKDREIAELKAQNAALQDISKELPEIKRQLAEQQAASKGLEKTLDALSKEKPSEADQRRWEQQRTAYLGKINPMPGNKLMIHTAAGKNLDPKECGKKHKEAMDKENKAE